MLLKSLYPKLTNKTMIIISSILLILGQILNVICPHHYFHVNQIMLLTMFLLEFMVIKHTQAGAEELKQIKKEFSFTDCSITSEIISFAFVTFFIATMFAVGCAEPTITGIYGGALGAIVLYIGIQAYIHYLSLLQFSFNLKNIKINDYSLYYPALTKWMRELSKEFQFIEKWFITLGLMYITIYAINIPQDFITATGLPLNMFLASWVGIFILFILAVPFLFSIRKDSLKALVCSCKENSLNYLEKKLANNTEQDRYALLIESVSKTENYPL